MATLDQTRKDAKTMKQSIRTTTSKFEAAKENTAKLLADLTQKATTLEKLKASLGMSTSLSAFLQLNEMSDEEEEDTDLLKDGLGVSHDCHANHQKCYVASCSIDLTLAFHR